MPRSEFRRLNCERVLLEQGVADGHDPDISAAGGHRGEGLDDRPPGVGRAFQPDSDRRPRCEGLDGCSLGSDQGGETAAICSSILAGAKWHRIEPWAYVSA